ncbi:Oidioi.mRNA.OKI2018_I69.XSR.g14303.t1.cds [Oikopleura dioica]|uniref:Oidioi.mRNA.OKI2018_I69.XSR.g14303.t1.cds n=1 Tax=Oikopleura dioica TaxID=34765 RepID=A0ABN7SB68_OIKDI|nr:Oidioi.mRNA.OKI2018_I69.XSR.g14303.t1.cds [Oikopleura dioica]
MNRRSTSKETYSSTVSGKVFIDPDKQKLYEKQREAIYALNAIARDRELAEFQKFMNSQDERSKEKPVGM